jgi:chromosome segregation ATPase
MGLFRRTKKQGGDNDIQRLRAELAVMRTRLDEAEAARAATEARLASLDATNLNLTQQVGSVGELAEHVRMLSERVASSGGRAGLTTDQIEGIQALGSRVEALSRQVEGQPLPPPSTHYDDQIAHLADEVDALRRHIESSSRGNGGHGTVSTEQLELLAQAIETRLAAIEQSTAEVEQLARQVDASIGEQHVVREKVNELARRVDEQPIITPHTTDHAVEIDELRGEIARINAHIDQPVVMPIDHSGEIDELRHQLDRLGDHLRDIGDQIVRQREQQEQTIQSLTSAPPPVDHSGAIDELRHRIAELGDRLGVLSDDLGGRIGALDQELSARIGALGDELGGHLGAIDRDLGEQRSAVEQASLTASSAAAAAAAAEAAAANASQLPPPMDHSREIDDLRNQLAELAERVGSGTRDADATRRRIDELDARLTSMATELANQLRELGHEMDTLEAAASEPGAGDEAVQALRDGQVRLAAEQARYEIAFREDLASLAEQIRRARSS